MQDEKEPERQLKYGRMQLYVLTCCYNMLFFRNNFRRERSLAPLMNKNQSRRVAREIRPNSWKIHYMPQLFRRISDARKSSFNADRSLAGGRDFH